MSKVGCRTDSNSSVVPHILGGKRMLPKKFLMLRIFVNHLKQRWYILFTYYLTFVLILIIFWSLFKINVLQNKFFRKEWKKRKTSLVIVICWYYIILYIVYKLYRLNFCSMFAVKFSVLVWYFIHVFQGIQQEMKASMNM